MMTEDDRRNWELAKRTVDSMQEPRDTRQGDWIGKAMVLQPVCGFDCSAHFYEKGQAKSQLVIWNNKYQISYSKCFGGNKPDDSRNIFAN